MNRQDLKKLIEELSADLIKSVGDFKQDLAQAKSLHTRVSNYVNETQASLDKFNDESSGLLAVLGSAKNNEAEINALKANAEGHLSSITANLGSIKAHIAEMENVYTQFTEINTKINDGSTGLESTYNRVKGIESQINDLKTGADAHLATIATDLENIKAHITEMENAYTQFTEINTKINDGSTGLEAILAESKSLKTDIEATKQTTETLFKEISQLKDAASSYASDLGKLNKSAKETVEKISKNHEESEALKSKINNIFNITSIRTHANYFDARQKLLAKTSLAWLGGFVIMLIVTIVLANKYISPLIEAIGNGQADKINNIRIEVFLIRLGLVTPAILATFYCLNQFGRERRLHEQYAFKAVSMLSVESSIELLARTLAKNTCPERDTHLALFAIKTLESIYKDPLDYEKRSLLFKGGNKLMQLSAEMNESIGEIKNDVDKLADNIKDQ